MSSADAAETVAGLLAEGRRRWRREGDWAGAELAFSRAIQLDPTCAAAFNDRGCLSAERGDLDRGFRDLYEAVRIDPQLAGAQANYSLLQNLVQADTGAATKEGPEWTTVSGSLIQGKGSSFADGLVAYLRGQLQVEAADRDLRDDAIQDVVLRVLSLARSEDLSLADALRHVRRSSTRAWVSKLIGLAKRRRGAPLPEGELGAREEPPAPRKEELLRLDALLNSIRDGVLARSQPTTRWRRRLVWDVYVGALLEGVHLRRVEVIAALRELGVSAKRARKSVLEADLDLIGNALRSQQGEAT